MIRYGDSCRMAVLYIHCTLEGLKCQGVTVAFSTIASVNSLPSLAANTYYNDQRET